MNINDMQNKANKADEPKNIKHVLLMFIDVLQYAEEKAPRGVHGNKNPFLSIWLRFPLRCTGLSGQVARSGPRSGTRPSRTLLSGQGNKHHKTKEEQPCNGDAHTDLVSRPLFFLSTLHYDRNIDRDAPRASQVSHDQ
jgi:hypothetical protein